ncbi:MAG: DUF4143 domain-containing protein, partial [archaeon]|nr:DUF4143 domain-containing protein [archaeon]
MSWKNSEYRECLLVKGARQVGKTYVIDRFLDDNYPNHLKIDFSLDTGMIGVFDGDLDIDRIIADISIRNPGFRPVPYETVLFFDEIQLCRRARSSLKSFVTDGRYRVIASGSLLGLTYKKDGRDEDVDILPVGYERSVCLKPMDFEEFLWAIGVDIQAVDHIRGCIRSKSPLSTPTVDRISRYFNVYTVVGGMPEVVCRYLDTKNFDDVRQVQLKILAGYRDDIKKYADRKDQDKIAASFDSIPVQLSQDNKKFRYSVVDADYVPTYATYESGINWMSDASIVERTFNLTAPSNPLPQFVNRKHFKIYMGDTGLLTCMLGIDTVHGIMAGDSRVNKGAVAENIVAQCISACGLPLYYFSNNGLEIDFILSLRGMVTAIEVKSGNNTKAKSLKSIHDNYRVKRRIKLEKTDIYVDNDGIEHYPLFACAFIDSM